jgi:hypothetical protein
VKIAVGALDAEPDRPERVEMRATGEKRHVDAGRRQPSAKIAAEAAAADDSDSHAPRMLSRSHRSTEIDEKHRFCVLRVSAARMLVPAGASLIATRG